MRKACRDCKGEIRSAKETYRYVESGLPNVVLLGVEVRRCSSCGAVELVLPRVTELHRTIAMVIVHKPARLSSAEVRFLRKHLGWSGTDFADHVGVDAATVSRWENDPKTPISAQSDRLLRMMVVREWPIDDYSLNDLAKIENREDPPISVKVRQRDQHWGVEAQA